MLREIEYFRGLGLEKSVVGQAQSVGYL